MLSKSGRIIPVNESEEKANLKKSVEKVPEMVQNRVSRSRQEQVARCSMALHIDSVRVRNGAMITRVISPLVVPMTFLGITYLVGRVYCHYEATGMKMRTWIVVAIWMACTRYSFEWHNEIGELWRNHPNVAAGSTLVAFLVMWMIMLTALVQPQRKPTS